MTEHHSAAVKQQQAPETNPDLSRRLREKMGSAFCESLYTCVPGCAYVFMSGLHFNMEVVMSIQTKRENVLHVITLTRSEFVPAARDFSPLVVSVITQYCGSALSLKHVSHQVFRDIVLPNTSTSPDKRDNSFWVEH